MSTILKALEKLEREKEAIRVSGPAPPVFSSPAPARGRAAGWFLKPWFGLTLVGLIIAILGGTAWYFYRQSRVFAPRTADRSTSMERRADRNPAGERSQAATSSVPAAAHPEPRRPGTVDHGRPQTADAPVQPMISSEPDHARNSRETSGNRPLRTPPVPETPDTHHPMVTVNPAAPSITPDRHTQRQDLPGTETPAPLEKSNQTRAATTGPPALPEAISKESTPADVYQNTPLLTDGRLRVHAIAWAPQPADRMTVINSHVLHEGDTVEDFTVKVIRPDDVVVQEKGKGVWRVEFGRP